MILTAMTFYSKPLIPKKSAIDRNKQVSKTLLIKAAFETSLGYVFILL